MPERLDEEKLRQIRVWAESMLTDERTDARAAARALLMLADEVERLWDASRSAFGRDVASALSERLGPDAPR